MKDTYQLQTEYQHVEDFKRLDFIVNQVKGLKTANLQIMDIGCGNGNISRALGALGYQILGVDIDAESIQAARKRNRLPNVRFEQMNAEALPKAGQFDVLVCSEVLEHLDRPGELLQTAVQLLKPGGLLLVTVPNGRGPREVLMTRPMQWMYRKGMGDALRKVKRTLGYATGTEQSSNPDLTHVQFFSRPALESLLHQYGFRLHQFGKADCIDRVFPFSMLANRLPALQRADCRLADVLPSTFTSGFYTSWKKNL